MQNENSSNNMSLAFSLFAFIAFITPSLSIFSGLGLAPAYIILSIVPFFSLFKNNKWKILYDGGLQKIVIVALLYILISCIWAIDPPRSLKLWVKLVFFAISAFALIDFIKEFSDEQKQKITNIFLFGSIIAIAIVAVEFLSGGFFTTLCHFYKPEYTFNLTDLNRGSSFFSIIVWPCVAMLLSRKKTLYAVLMGGSLLIATHYLESTSAVMGIVLGFVVAFLVYIFGKKFIKLLMVGVVFGIFAIPVVTVLTSAEQLNSAIPEIPGAASMYRIYIWDFAGHKALEKPVLGWGFDASRKMPVKKSDYIPGGRYPLPLHPHNNTLQVWLELGFVGLVLFAAFLVAILRKIIACESRLYMSFGAGLFSSYFIIGQVGYGIWQNWWIAAGLIALGFLRLNSYEKADS